MHHPHTHPQALSKLALGDVRVVLQQPPDTENRCWLLGSLGGLKDPCSVRVFGLNVIKAKSV